jgi:hypothetical protein
MPCCLRSVVLNSVEEKIESDESVVVRKYNLSNACAIRSSQLKTLTQHLPFLKILLSLADLFHPPAERAERKSAERTVLTSDLPLRTVDTSDLFDTMRLAACWLLLLFLNPVVENDLKSTVFRSFSNSKRIGEVGTVGTGREGRMSHLVAGRM